MMDDEEELKGWLYRCCIKEKEKVYKDTEGCSKMHHKRERGK